ncbi:MAG: hypothetical protein FWJ83_04060, partial [Limnochordales bacterium]
SGFRRLGIQRIERRDNPDALARPAGNKASAGGGIFNERAVAAPLQRDHMPRVWFSLAKFDSFPGQRGPGNEFNLQSVVFMAVSSNIVQW